MNKFKALIIGLKKTGVSVACYLKSQGCSVYGYDLKSLDRAVLNEKLSFDALYLGGEEPRDLDFDICVIAPGVPTDKGFAKRVIDSGVEVISEIELACRNLQGVVVGITGTNGKTTTTKWTEDVFLRAKKRAYACGNIGVSMIEIVSKYDAEDTYYIAELSSYQLERTFSLEPKTCAILNVTEDHLQRHKTMENYTEAKKRIYQNMTDLRYLILNLDNEITKNISDEISNCTTVSVDNHEADYAIIDSYIVENSTGMKFVSTDDIFLKGKHNLENALFVVAMARLCGIDREPICQSLMNFMGVEHRNEYLGEIDGVKFYNDSKATNPEASIPALRSISTPIVLIAGGMDKRNSYDEWIDEFDNVREVLLFGETKYDIAKAMERKGRKNYVIVSTLREAVEVAKNYLISGDSLLLSPACASWDMYESFEARGDEFKSLISNWREHFE